MSDMKNNEETLDKIIDSAIFSFNKDGFSGASISTITNHAGVAKGNLYYYFKKKDDLYLHCAKKCIYDFKKYLNDNLNYSEDDELLVIKLLDLRIRFFEINPNYLNLFLNIVAKKPDHLAEALTEIRREFKDENLKLFMNFLSHIKLGKGVTTNDIITLVSFLENYTALGVETSDKTKDFEDESKAISRMVTIFINGLKEDIE